MFIRRGKKSSPVAREIVRGSEVRRQETELGQITKARALVLPDNKPQERTLTIAPFLARYGPSLVRELDEAIETWYASALEGVLDPS